MRHTYSSLSDSKRLEIYKRISFLRSQRNYAAKQIQTTSILPEIRSQTDADNAVREHAAARFYHTFWDAKLEGFLEALKLIID